MYMGVILDDFSRLDEMASIPHVYGGDPKLVKRYLVKYDVFPMYMGVIPQ